MKAGRNTKRVIRIFTVCLCLLTLSLALSGCNSLQSMIDWFIAKETTPQEAPTVEATQPPTETEPAPPEPTEFVPVWKAGYLATLQLDAQYYDENGTALGTLLRGAQVEYAVTPEGKTILLVDGVIVNLQEGAYAVSDPARVIPAHSLYVRTAVNLRDAEGKLLEVFADKGTAVGVTGCDYLLEDGTVHMYRVNCGAKEGYILPWYLADNKEDAKANYDDGDYKVHAGRKNRYGGGGAADLDYYPREKGAIAGNEMPEECRTLYINSRRISEVDDYLKIAKDSGINAFVVDIVDGGSVGYAADVMKAYCPSGAANAKNTVKKYQAAITKIKDAGYYVIGRITTFNDVYFAKDHPEHAITNEKGKPLKLSNAYWPTPYSRTAWQYKVDLAVEAVELMGFHEIQFDYVRFPDRVSKYEKAGQINYHNTNEETKAQAIQRFLMYAADILHEKGAYVSADVFGECAYNYVTAYGQYWPAISNVVDVISGMPYPDHFGASGDWLPWEHPYDTLYTWGKNAMNRQKETATPAVIRTWIQAYDAIRKPHNTYGPKEIKAQIKGLRESGCTGGYMTWNGSSSLDKYKSIRSAFKAPKKD